MCTGIKVPDHPFGHAVMKRHALFLPGQEG